MNHKVVLSARREGLCLGILVVTTLIIYIPRFVAFPPEGRGWSVARVAIVYGLMVSLPLLVARIAPRAAGFDKQWLPSMRSQWGWFLGMLLLLFLGGGLVTLISGLPGQRVSSYELIRPTTIVILGVILVLIGPVAEEIFWRGYFLEQLRKITLSSVALVSQSLLFALSHRWLLDQGAVFLVAPFWYGLILGIWRIRFQSILPLMLAHVILNAVVLVPVLKTKYDFTVNLWSKPHAQQIDLLTREPMQKALPAIIALLADPDKDVSNYAVLMLTTRYGQDAEPYLKEALASTDIDVVKNVLFVISLKRLSGLTEDVRRVAWSGNSRTVQLAATLALHDLGDAEGLQDIAQKHPDEIVRRTAKGKWK